MKSIRSTSPRLLACLLALSGAVAACGHDSGELVSETSAAASIIKCPSPSPSVNLGDQPVAFVANEGQSADGVLFQGVLLGAGTLAVTAKEVRLDLADFPGTRAIPAASIVIKHLDGSLALAPAPGSALASTTTFITKTGTQSYVPNHGALAQEDLYPGIGMELGGTARKLVTTYTVAPGASPASIQWSYDGASDLKIDDGVGSVSVAVAGGERTLSLGPAAAHQVIQGQQVAVAATYVINDGVLGVELAPYDISEPLVITTQLLHSPYFEAGGTTALDNGRTYAVGRGYHAASSVNDTRGDAYVAMLNAAGQMISTTFVIGEADDEAHAVAVAHDGQILVSGETRSLSFPTLGAAQDANAGGSDGFVITLDSEAASLLHGTYLGGAGDDAATGVTEGPTGDILVASTTTTPATARNASAASFLTELPAKGPSAETVPYTFTALGATLTKVKSRVPFTGARIRRPRAWVDCNGRVTVGVFGLRNLDCTTFPDLDYSMLEYGKNYVQDQPSYVGPYTAMTFGWGFHALRWKSHLVNDPTLPGYTPTALSWLAWSTSTYSIPRQGAPNVGSLGDDVGNLNWAEDDSPGLFTPSNPRGTWDRADHDTIEILAIKAALVEHRWGSPVYVGKVSFDDFGAPYKHAMVVEKTSFDVCVDPGLSNYAGQGIETLCTMPNVADWYGNVDCSSSGIHDVTFSVTGFTVSTWGEHSPNPTYFHESFPLDAYPAGWQNQWWYERGSAVYDPPAEELQASQKLDEAAARLAGRATATIAAEAREFKDGVAGKITTVTVTARAIDLH
jgi:hypothetical protein